MGVIISRDMTSNYLIVEDNTKWQHPLSWCQFYVIWTIGWLQWSSSVAWSFQIFIFFQKLTMRNNFLETPNYGLFFICSSVSSRNALLITKFSYMRLIWQNLSICVSTEPEKRFTSIYYVLWSQGGGNIDLSDLIRTVWLSL